MMHGVVGISIVGRLISSFSYHTRTSCHPEARQGREYLQYHTPGGGCLGLIAAQLMLRDSDGWDGGPGGQPLLATLGTAWRCWRFEKCARCLLIFFIKSINSDGRHEFTTQILVWFQLWIQLRLLLWFLRIQAWIEVNYLTVYISG